VASSSRSADIPWLVLRAELVGTAVLVLVGLSLVILMFGKGSPIPSVLPSEGWRRLITGFLFGATGALIALCRSPGWTLSNQPSFNSCSSVRPVNSTQVVLR
jgi:hypothetical protein